MSPAALAARWRQVGIYAAAALVLLYSLGPFLWIFIASLTPERKGEWGAISGRGVTYLPTQPTLQNYIDVFGEAVTWKTYLNTLKYCAIVWAITFALGALPQPLLDLANNAARFLP